ncbi:MAG: CDP-diacylglycerol--glycerol-3-phosphate 3-phosphatidyltransferase [Rhodobiaceae bacterium]|nr:CDP-diacylglycerol--glycerol-3-phosphate 3-phosphatidyltransferase [Rhodobiaceae bacterium]MCC0015291.1 CDP-diacylglycerol--glycerol-3-phosphate 3-phosphatidyltransferase [Rhodobiaceae bacterium]MCC0042487.1 CDP-diacylglycerol--glycerol-3-phosphate 3-phosphatidyltransferase [Rhodobiaceae bacterium]MCC0053470.1 CDP-diacylglycerol--glycerol-3-phosphate 3-phosphatidyltransferase [Rhodobiaceae bacterium]
MTANNDTIGAASGAARSGRGRDQLAALPNLLTYARIAAVPLFVACFFVEGHTARWVALAIFIAASVTDFLDGYLARAYDQHSSLGRMLDPIADKLLVAAALLALTYVGTIGGFSLWAALVILSREILVSGLREFLAEVRVSVPVSRLAKWKTALQMTAIGFLVAGPAGDALFGGEPVTLFGIAGLWIAAVLTLYTGYDYFRAGFRYLLDEA